LTYSTVELTMVLNPVHWCFWKFDIYYVDGWGCRKDYPTINVKCVFLKLDIVIDNGDW
jgi:hypothetical protein